MLAKLYATSFLLLLLLLGAPAAMGQTPQPVDCNDCDCPGTQVGTGHGIQYVDVQPCPTPLPLPTFEMTATTRFRRFRVTAGNMYRVTTCGATALDVEMRITENGLPYTPVPTACDDDGCGVTDGAAAVTFLFAVGHALEAATGYSDRLLHGEDLHQRPPPHNNLLSQKMGIHEWSYDNDIAGDLRFKVPWTDSEIALASISVEVELGFDAATAFKEAQRCLNCDVQTVFTERTCIECDACVDICPMDCISFTENADEAELRPRLKAPALNLAQDLYVSAPLKTGRVMVKDEDLCLHCSLCAERCPTGAWDMHRFLFQTTQAGPGCRDALPARPLQVTP